MRVFSSSGSPTVCRAAAPTAISRASSWRPARTKSRVSALQLRPEFMKHLRTPNSLGWVHTVSTPGLTLLAYHARRGIDAIVEIGVLVGYRGTLSLAGSAVPGRRHNRGGEARHSALPVRLRPEVPLLLQ